MMTGSRYRKYIQHRSHNTSGNTIKPTIDGFIYYFIQIMKMFCVQQVVNMDIIQSLLQYLMSSINITTFIAVNGMHAYTPACDSVVSTHTLSIYLSIYLCLII